MRVVLRIGALAASPGPHVATIGNFDGVHRGHREILRRAVEHARKLGGAVVAITFYPHPIAVLAPERAPLQLGGLGERLRNLSEAGADTIVLQRFSKEFAAVSAEAFVERFLARTLRVREVVVGHNVGFGHNRAGNAALLEEFGRRWGFGVEVVPPVSVGGQVVSSSAIRSALQSGDLAAAEVMLGSSYRVSGRVRRGFSRGQRIGFATANLVLRGVQLPPDGVYAVRVALEGGRLLPGVANLGYSPTFAGEQRTLEAHIFDFNEDLYRTRLAVEFVARLREERKFPHVDALVAQIKEDAEAARQLLAAK